MRPGLRFLRIGNLEIVIGVLFVIGFLVSRVIKSIRSEDWKGSKAPRGTGGRTPPVGRKEGEAPSRPAAPSPAFRSEAEDHEHITVPTPSKKARLGQLRYMYEAGLLDDEEYEERKRKVEEDGR